MARKQKVRFHRGDRKPKSDKEYDTLTYKVKMKKKGRKICMASCRKTYKQCCCRILF